MDLSQFPKINVVPYPTPLEQLVQLRNVIKCKPRLYVKRDDTTIVGLGGNKNRKLQYVMADACRQGADVAITAGGVQSNHCRQTLTFARISGMECHLVLTGEEPVIHQGNSLIFKIMGAKLHFIGANGNADGKMHAIADELRSSGLKPYIIPIGASSPLGVLGYIESFMEVIAQTKALGIKLQHCFVPIGSGSTQAGIEIGARELCPSMKVHGVSVNHVAHLHKETLSELVNGAYKLLGSSKTTDPLEFTVHDRYRGKGYAIPTEDGNEAIKLCARTEGLILDPVYTGKAVSGMIDLLRQGVLDDAEAILFFHTGGYPALFAMAEHFQ